MGTPRSEPAQLSVRIDQWLWSARLVKTRSDAAAACRSGHESINGKRAKPSSPVAVGDRVEAFVSSRRREVVVTTLITKRVGAAVAADCFDDHSPPPPERESTDGADVVFAARERGSGRPTKRDRRQLDRLRGRR